MDDDDFLPISGLQHMAFCERQCALIHIEREWEENRLTAEGKTLHERVDEGYREFRKGMRQFSSVHVQSSRLGLHGRLDVLEVSKTADGPDNVRFLGLDGEWEMFPVEFKRGKPKEHDSDQVQLCAQAMCLEEMTGVVIATGALFYGELRRRDEVTLGESLRDRVTQLAERFHRMMKERRFPAARWAKHCRACSLLSVCQPRSRDGPEAEDYKKELLG